MAMPKNISAYDDCFDLFEAALADPLGCRALIGKHEDAKKYQMRMNTARVTIREESMRIYKRDDPRWGKSVYDTLKVTVKEDVEGYWWVYVEPHRQDVLVIQPLSDLDSGPSSGPELISGPSAGQLALTTDVKDDLA